MPPIRVMIVDDHYLVRMGLASIIALESDLVVCCEASSAEDAIRLFRQHRPDVTLMDVRLPGQSGTEATASLRREFADARILVISTYAGDEEVHAALEAGAMGYLVKSAHREELVQAIRKAAAGCRHVPAALAARLADRVSRSQLSARELDVLRLVVDGRRNRQIASTLAIAEGTVKLHVSSILAKLGVEDRTEAVTVALRRGILQLEP